MTRTRADALVLVNWKGVFFERYQLDRHVTALEGANGAGKTTVMIAAYLALLPDMTRLRFTNVGESGATGGDRGIWGRLGKQDRPTYAALDFALGTKQRLIAGVHLVRKGAPSVEPTPFVVTGLSPSVRLQELLLLNRDEQEFVPELHELRENAAQLGGRLQELSARDYFATLFDHGVTPLRLGTDEERNKLNEMLRTSMTGGISRTLTSELRSFLLKEEGGLADTLQRMRANLDACRRTRTEVEESRKLEQEISFVFEAGDLMFAAAFLATRARAEDLAKRVAEAEAVRVAAGDALARGRDELAKTAAELAAFEGRRAQLGALLESSHAWHIRLRAALDALRMLERRVAELQRAAEEAAEAEQVQAAAKQERERCRAERRRAEDGHKRAADGVAKLQSGLEELHRRASSYKRAVRQLHEAELLLDTAPLVSADFGRRLSAARTELVRIDEERRDAGTQLADAQAHRQRHGAVMAGLATLMGAATDVSLAYEQALQALRQYRDWIALSQRLPAIEHELVGARRLAADQQRVRAFAESLAVQAGTEPAAVLVERLWAEADAKRTEHEEGERTAAIRASDEKRALEGFESRRRELVVRQPDWREHEARAARLRAHLALPVADRPGLDAARAALAEQHVAARKLEEATQGALEELKRQARELLAAGGPFPPELLALRDRLGAELVAGSFEDTGLAEAAVLEARLGELAHGLVVDDPMQAARAIAGRPDALQTVLLLPADADLLRMGRAEDVAEVGPRDVAVQDGVVLRVTRVPSHPRLGLRARERRAAELRIEAEGKEHELESAKSQRRALERLLLDGDALLAGQAVWLAGDPAPELEVLQQAIAASEERLQALRTAGAQHSEALRQLRPQLEGLRKLLGEALLLDPPDHAERARQLEGEREVARLAKLTVAAKQHAAELVESELATLRLAPISEAEAVELSRRVDELKVRRERLDAGIEALSYVNENLEALGWGDAEDRLNAKGALVPALQKQLQEAEEQRSAAELADGAAEEHLEAAAKQFRESDARRAGAAVAHTAAHTTFEELGVPEPDPGAVLAAAREVEQLEQESRALEARRDPLIGQHGALNQVVIDEEKRLKEAEEKHAGVLREAKPALAQWEELQESAQKYHLIGTLLSETPGPLQPHVSSQVHLMQEAKAKHALLLDRLRTAQGGPALLAEMTVLRDTSDVAFAEGYLTLWLRVRDWLRRRLPAQVAEVDDPREALLLLRDRLSSLEQRLRRQEKDLRGASEDVANSIHVQVRKAGGQVTRLNKNLLGIGFGSIQGIRVRLQTIDKMQQILRALQEGATQELLFQKDIPFEQALDEIFRTYGGGRGGGQRLLDYREYVHLQVEIRRKVGTEWEVANPTQLSTGEAIGVGAALMMVVLSEWERDSTLLRGKKAHGSLRFLFLDEANRLSHDNLGVLFDLCQTLDLQLLIAAPEVAQAEGNTTYRLVRQTTAEGLEEVLVTGRRTRAEA